MKTKILKTIYLAVCLTTAFWILGTAMFFILPHTSDGTYSEYMSNYMKFATEFFGIMAVSLLIGGSLSALFHIGYKKLFTKNEKNS